ncbi:hypothetical protein JOM56_015380 [Amanita muscaria]
MPELPSHGACNISNCQCDATVFQSSWSCSPSHPEERCLCGHPYWQHRALIDDSGEIGVCSITGCGGYCPKTDGIEECACGRNRGEHATMNPAPDTLAALARSHPALAYRDVATSGVARGTDGNAFQLWAATPPSSGSVHQQRTASSASRQRGTPNRRRARQTFCRPYWQGVAGITPQILS